MSPRPASTCSSSTSEIDIGAYARSSAPSRPGIECTLTICFDGSTITASPVFTSPRATMPAQDLKSLPCRSTVCTGNRNGPSAASLRSGTVSRYSSRFAPVYHGVFALRSTTLSPASAHTGMKSTWHSPSRSTNSRNVRLIASKTSCRKPVRSILFTATTIRRIPSRCAIAACRRVCASTPLRASVRITASCAVDAPVAMLRVYCSWPGVSAMMKRRRGVAKWRYATSIVIPCSRSARKPSVRNASSNPSRDTRRTASIWSSYSVFVSCSNRPISVDLPSSTLPAVVNRSSSGPRSRASIVKSTLPFSSTPWSLPGRDRWPGFRALSASPFSALR